jgi:hypothetical protein
MTPVLARLPASPSSARDSYSSPSVAPHTRRRPPPRGGRRSQPSRGASLVILRHHAPDVVLVRDAGPGPDLPAGTFSSSPVIARRGTPHGSGLGAHRWVIEQTITLLHWFRRLRIRWEIRDDIHEAFMTLAAAIICWRRLTR